MNYFYISNSAVELKEHKSEGKG